MNREQHLHDTLAAGVDFPEDHLAFFTEDPGPHGIQWRTGRDTTVLAIHVRFFVLLAEHLNDEQFEQFCAAFAAWANRTIGLCVLGHNFFDQEMAEDALEWLTEETDHDVEVFSSVFTV